MATLVAQQISLPSLLATYAAAAVGGDQVASNANLVLHVKNGHTSPQTVTIVTQRPAVAGYVATSNAVAVANATEQFIPLSPPEAFTNATGFILITYSGVTALTVAVLRL